MQILIYIILLIQLIIYLYCDYKIYKIRYNYKLNKTLSYKGGLSDFVFKENIGYAFDDDYLEFGNDDIWMYIKLDRPNEILIDSAKNLPTVYRITNNKIFKCYSTHNNFKGKGFINYYEEQIGTIEEGGPDTCYDFVNIYDYTI